MITLDKIKIVSSLENVIILDENQFARTEKNGKLLNLTYTLTDPYGLYVELDYKNNELVIEFSGKILRDAYPQLINRDTIRSCFNNINELGVCHLDVEAIMVDGQVCKIDVTKDIECDDCKSLTTDLRASINNFNKYLPRVISGNFVIEKNVKTKGCKKRLTVYDKDNEMRLAQNKSFLRTLKDSASLLEYFTGKTRVELNLNSKEQIRKSLHISDTHIATVLNSEENPILAFVLDVIDVPAEQPQLTSYKEYLDYLVLRDNDFDLAKVQAKIKVLRPKARLGRVMPAFRMLVNKVRPGCVTLRERLLNLLLLEIFLIVFPSVLI